VLGSVLGTVVLSAAQRDAVGHVRSRSVRGRAVALVRLGALGADPATLLAAIRERGRVTLNFHPDRLLADGRTTVAASLAADGRYRSQFETGISNGGLTAYPGGDRDRWEQRMFGGAYQRPGTAAGERPVYGALDLLGHADGAAPRFGSCHIRLRPPAAERCTFCFEDSHLDPPDVGTIDAFEAVLAGLLEYGGSVGGPGPRAREHGRVLDHYIEAQVHGGVDLAADAEAIVLDPSFRGTAAAALLADAARRFGVPLEWHPGFELPAHRVPAGFRGPAIPPFAAHVAREYGRGGLLDAEVLGRAAASVVTEPQRWARWGTPAETLQYVKQLWHVLVRFGRPAASGDGPGDMAGNAR
jgi:hypothetical protein